MIASNDAIKTGTMVDRWDFIKWRKTLRYTQAEAASELDINRGTIQNWEHGVTRIPRAVELACTELTRRRKQKLDYGPVVLVYADKSMWQQIGETHHMPVLQCESYRNNEVALQRACRLRNAPHFVSAFIIDEDGGTIWNGPDLIRQCDKLRIP
jgi:DNA-binding XRE family transcriptional regulator